MQVETTTTTKFTIKINSLKELKSMDFDSIPAHANLYVRIPGGGDCSNMSLEIDKDCPLVIIWSEVKRD